MSSDPLPFDPHRFSTAAAHYRAGRAAYPPLLIRRVAEAVGVGEADRVLDLGCGPGQLAIGFGYFAAEVVGLDPEPRMLAAATAAALGLTPNVCFRQGSSYTLNADLGRFRLVTMGRSFHWMDRAATLERLDQMIEPGGAVALFHDTHLEVPENDWRKRWREIIEHYTSGDPVRQRRKAGTWRSHEAVLLESPLCRLERISLVQHLVSTNATLLERALSMSSTSRARIGERVDALLRDLSLLLAEIAPDGVATEVLEWSALIARRA